MDAVQRFRELVGRPDPPLDRAALALAAGAEPRLEEARWLAVLDALADGVSDLDGLRHRLFTEQGFRGDAQHYYDPRNSLLPHVLTRRRGIPITLSVVAMEVGRRAGVPLEGVGMPGHFLARPVGGDRLLDAFAGGALLTPAECEARYRELGGTGAFGPHLLRAIPTPAILTRMLENLRGVYRARQWPAGTEWVLRMRLALPGAGPAEWLELAEALGAQARWDEGARLLEEAASRAPDEVADRMRLAARSLRAHLN